MSEHAHDFDFWIGEWDVTGPDGTTYGRNSIASPFGNGILTEHWRGAGGVEGHSLNAYDAARGCWHQTWVDSGGSILMLDGGLVDGAMVLTGSAPDDDHPGRVLLQRITWTPGPDEEQVRQHWETSADDGGTWETAFDGRYRRR
jgi:hypothetical protein